MQFRETCSICVQIGVTEFYYYGDFFVWKEWENELLGDEFSFSFWDCQGCRGKFE
jgi:hypothetical protein